MEERGHILHATKDEEPSKDSNVFYNPEMILNRDISTVAAEVFKQKIDTEEFHICDPLSASGIRGFRYAKTGTQIHFNDANPKAVESIKKGVKDNKIKKTVKITNKDANVLLSENRNRFHLIDIDPFGPFTNYLDSTARAANHQSLVALTATDNAVTAGTYTKTCKRRYASQPVKNSFMHETGLRIYLKEAFQNFARYDKSFEPKICFHEKHYTRIIGRVTESKKRTNKNLENIGHLSYCPQCRWRKLEKTGKCERCGEKTRIAGPLWTGKISDRRFTEHMLEKIPGEWIKTREKLEKIHDESEILTPFYDVHKLASQLKKPVPKREKIIGKLRDTGYPISRTHFTPTGIRTDAPLEDILNTLKNL